MQLYQANNAGDSLCRAEASSGDCLACLSNPPNGTLDTKGRQIVLIPAQSFIYFALMEGTLLSSKKRPIHLLASSQVLAVMDKQFKNTHLKNKKLIPKSGILGSLFGILGSRLIFKNRKSTPLP